MTGKKILAVTDSFMPDMTMNGIIMKNLLDEIADENHIEMIAVRRSRDDITQYKNVKVRYVETHAFHLNRLRKEVSSASAGIIKTALSMKICLVRLKSVIQRYASPYGLNQNLIDGIRKALPERAYRGYYDCIICIGIPFESFAAVLDLCDSNISTIITAFQVDDFITAKDASYPFFLLKQRNKNRKILADQFLSSFDRYYVFESVYQKEADFFSKYEKAKPIGLPLMVNKRKDRQNKKSRDFINIVYAGSLTKKERPPQGCLDLLVKSSDRIQIHLYHRGDCDDVINDYCRKYKGKIRNHGAVSSELSYEAINNADILISISTYSGDQISGKTFDYISTGKPVLFFYYKKTDRNKMIFDKYQLALCVSLRDRDIGSAVKDINDFILCSAGKQAEFEDVCKMYEDYDPKKIAEVIFD